jgi:hypothetical protein
MDQDEILTGEGLAIRRLSRPKIDIMPAAPQSWPPLP